MRWWHIRSRSPETPSYPTRHTSGKVHARSVAYFNLRDTAFAVSWAGCSLADHHWSPTGESGIGPYASHLLDGLCPRKLDYNESLLKRGDNLVPDGASRDPLCRVP